MKELPEEFISGRHVEKDQEKGQAGWTVLKKTLEEPVYMSSGKHLGPHFRNFLGRSWNNSFPNKECTFSKLLWQLLWKNLGKYIGKHQPCLT